MFNPTELFKQRLASHIKLLNRYLRYIFNGHFMIALIFIIVTIAVYYRRWLDTVSDEFPAAFMIALALTFIVLYNPLQSFLKEPDKVFLIVKEEKIYRYFHFAFFYNYITQLYIAIFIIAAISPVYFAFYPERSKALSGLVVLIVLILKGWNLLLTWHFIQVDDGKIRISEKIARTILTFLLFYSIISIKYFIAVGFIYIVYSTITYSLAKKETQINWEKLIRNDLERLALFYRFVSLFADVPHLKSPLRKRRFLTNLVRKYTPFQFAQTPTYLYRLTFLRSSDYFSLYIRLTIIAIILIIFVPNDWLKVVLAILFIYMTSFQMQSLYYHYRTNMWLDLYPIEETRYQTAFLKLSQQLSVLQTIILTVTFLTIGNILFSSIMLVVGLIFTLAFHQFYIKKKIKTADFIS